MRWNRGGGPSEDLEDRRGQGAGGGGGFGGGGMRLGLGGFVILAILSIVFKKNFFALVGGGDAGPSAGTSSGPRQPGPRSADPAEEERVKFVSFVLDDSQATWTKLMPQYRRAKLVLFTDAVNSACGFARSATGPFYCPGDQKVYIDLGFYDELKSRFGAPGDFAQAYVITHEIGHHVQNLLGIDQQMRRQVQARPDLENALSVRLELQADCFAGVWGNSTKSRGILESGDLESGLNAAAAIGDDRLQKQASGRVSPESFTHGSSAQRVRWFKRGFDTGAPKECDTFKARDL